jgi:pteridine reductase
MDIRGKVALVTGGARRVGKAIALALAEDGADVAIHFAGSGSEAEETLAELKKHGSNSHSFQADLRSAAAPAELVARVADTMNGLDVVINSAAVMLRTPLGQVTVEEWDDIMSLNLRAPFFIAQEAANVLPEGGCIVNIADLAAFETWTGYIPHGISKAGVVQMTRALAHALGPRIRVNAVAPGVVLLPEGWADDSAERLARTTPLRRNGSPADVVHAVRYLLSADFVTGQTIVVDGGRQVRR